MFLAVFISPRCSAVRCSLVWSCVNKDAAAHSPNFAFFSLQGCTEPCQSHSSALPSLPGVPSTSRMLKSPLTSAQSQPEPPCAGPNSLQGCSDKLITISSSRGLQGTRGASPPRQALLRAEVSRAAFPSGEMPGVTLGTQPEPCLPAQPSKPIQKGSNSSKQLQALAQQLRGRRLKLPVPPDLRCSSRKAPSHLSDPLLGAGKCSYHLEGEICFVLENGEQELEVQQSWNCSVRISPGQGRRQRGDKEVTNLDRYDRDNPKCWGSV